MREYSWFFVAALAMAALTSCPPAPEVGNKAAVRFDTPTATVPAYDGPKPKNIILMIGDGMGITQISAGLYSNGNRLEMERFRTIGLHKSYSGNNLITDSAAGATAFSAGVKTYNGAIGVDMDTLPVKTILEYAEERGMPTGLVANSSIVHATPASFAAHDPYRKNYEAIAADMSASGADLLIGGGVKFFERRDSDTRNLSEEMKANAYDVDNFIRTEMKDLPFDSRRTLAYLTADSEPLPFSQGRDYLVRASEMAPRFLDERDAKNKGFFLMIEGSQIDWGGHSNDSDYIISEVLEFDAAIGKALDFAAADGETLVIVTADHETGGYAIQNGSEMGRIDGAFTSDYHTADLIPVFAAGPGSEIFGGIYENTGIFDRMMALYGFTPEKRAQR